MIYGMQDIKLLGCEQQKRWNGNIQASPVFIQYQFPLNLAVAAGGHRAHQ